MSTTAPEFWGAHAAEYDSLIRRTVPRYEELTERLVDALPATATSVLELGCGTGNLSLRLTQRATGARFTFVDASAEMTAITRSRLESADAAAAQRARFVEATFESLPSEPDAYDAIVAMISLHHVADLEPVYSRLAASLRPGGRLLNADAVRAESEALHTLHIDRWHAYWREPGNLTAEELAAVADHVDRHDHYEPLSRHFAWLREAGLREADCVWRDGLFALLVAQR